MGICIPPEYGGAGMDMLSYMIAVEEISKACASTAVIMAVNNSLFCSPVLDYGSEELKQKYLIPCATGTKLGCFALSEPDAGSDAGNQKTKAVLDGDEYVINGAKNFITNGAEADFAIVFTNTNPQKGKRGITAFIVETDTEGFTVAKKEEKLGLHACSTCELSFQDMKVPKENILANEGRGFRIAMETLNSGRITIGAQALGIAEAAFEAAVKFAKERHQFGVPISSFQAIQWMLADMATELEAARLISYWAATLKDEGKDFITASAMAKLKASEVARFVCDRALQIHGGYGYTKDYPLERYYRDQKITEIYEGTSEIQRLVIATRLLK